MGEKGKVCVTGAGGFLASWLVKLLLSKDLKVQGTVRDPASEKNIHLKKLDKASENLQLFKADLLDYDSLCAAFAGCDGVFHLASAVTLAKVPNPEEELIKPIVMGTQNVLKACSEVKVRRVVMVSSLAAVHINPNWPQDKAKDEYCWSDKEFCKTNEKWYCLAKAMAEGEALEYAKISGLEVVTVCPCMVIGPLLQPMVNDSTSFLISLLKGELETLDNPDWHFVDVRDVVEALLLTYEKPEASGRYLCASHTMRMRDFMEKVKGMYPKYKYPTDYIEVDQEEKLSSEKLKKLGWKYRDLDETIKDAVESLEGSGLLKRD